MKLLYLTSACSENKFNFLIKNKRIVGQFQNQKFHNLLLKGLTSSGVEEIKVISFYPIVRTYDSFLRVKYEEEIENGITYIYPNCLNLPIIHHISKFIGTYKSIRANVSEGSLIVCNIMDFDECLAAQIYRFFHKIKICAITADVPGITSGAGNNVGAWWKRLLTRLVYPFYKSMSKQYDAYMFLAPAMNDVVNPRKKPFVIIEGLADMSMNNYENSIKDKYPKVTMMYAGGLHKEYGVDLLVEAFHMLKEDDAELHLYGKGNYEDEIKRLIKEDSRIKYFGIKPNSEIVKAQLKSHILINPRPTAEPFVKYSFPSKIIECMASGTPLLTTRIPSMPSEYYPYIYILDEESVEGYCKSFSKTLSLSNEQLYEKGKDAKSFILKEKNYIVQAVKLRQLFDSILLLR